MNRLKRICAALVAVTLLICCGLCTSASAASQQYADPYGEVLSIAHLGDSRNYPACTLESIEAAFDMGVDMVSVPVAKTSDGELVLMKSNELSLCCADENGQALSGLVSEMTYEKLQKCFLLLNNFSVSSYHPVTLEMALILAQDDRMLVLDNAWQYRDEIDELALSANVPDNVIIRTDASAKEITQWLDAKKPVCEIMGVYSGNIVFMATSKADTLFENGMSAVQYSSGNFFAAIFDTLAMKRFRRAGNGRAAVATYDKSLCGQREDSSEGWNDLIARGYSIIETENPQLLSNYLLELDEQKAELKKLCEYAENVDTSHVSPVSGKNLLDAIKTAKDALVNPSSSCSNIEDALSALNTAIRAIVPGTGVVDTQKNSLNITAGKIIAVILGAAAVVAAQIYVHKRQKKNKSRMK